MSILSTETVNLEASVWTCDMESLKQPERSADRYDISSELENALASFGFYAHITKVLTENPEPSTDEWEDKYIYKYGVGVFYRIGDTTSDLLTVDEGDKLVLLGYQQAVVVKKEQ